MAYFHRKQKEYFGKLLASIPNTSAATMIGFSMWGDEDLDEDEVNQDDTSQMYYDARSESTQEAADFDTSPGPCLDQPLKDLFQSDNTGFKFEDEHEETQESFFGKCWDFVVHGCPQCGSKNVDIHADEDEDLDEDEEHFLYWVCEDCKDKALCESW
eukprot:10928077-Karenia_brevis.AAC.1